MDANIVVKKELDDSDQASPGQSEDNSRHESLTIHSPVKYVSRRGRPPGGGYSMKSNQNLINLSSTYAISGDFGHQLTSSSSSLSPPVVMKTSTGDSLDLRRFAFSGFDADKSSFRCDGCDIVFSSRDTYAMHMLLRAKNESCVALPTCAISSNPENPTPREKFERELRQQAMLTALRSQAAVISKAAASASILPKASSLSESLSVLSRAESSLKEKVGASLDSPGNASGLFSLEAYGMYLDPGRYQRMLTEYGLRTADSSRSLVAMMEQLTCTVCGELFSNKDALAMHMMFHTRSGDGDPKDRSSGDAATSTYSRHAERRNTSHSQNSSEDLASGPENNKPRSFFQNADRQLTAERVAELKRMAIESSLRASVSREGKTISSQTLTKSTRPRSVSSETVSTSVVQNRPLSADDARKFLHNNEKNNTNYLFTDYEKNYFLNSRAAWERQSPVTDRKRHASSSLGNVFDNLQWSLYEMHKKQPRYNQDIDLRDQNSMPSLISSEQVKIPNISDPVVSSASNANSRNTALSTISTEDATVVSNGHSAAEEPRATIRQRGSPYLDAIMSKEAVLVPVDSNECLEESDIDRNLLSVDERTRELTFENCKTAFGSRFGNSSFFNAKNRPDSETTIHTRAGGYFSRPPFSNNSTGTYHSSKTNGGHRSNNSRLFAVPGYASSSMTTSTQENKPSRSSSPSDEEVIVEEQNDEIQSRDVTRSTPSRNSEARYCPHCEILYLDVTLFHLHMGLHNVNNPWQCNTCGMVCSGRLEFNTHVLHY